MSACFPTKQTRRAKNSGKNFILLLLLVTISLMFVACSSDEDNKVEYIEASNIEKERIPVYGMTCVGCEVTLEKSISKEKGLVSVKASHKKEVVVIEYDKSKTNKEIIKNSIKNSGYKLTE